MPEGGTGQPFPTEGDVDQAREAEQWYGKPEERFAKGYQARVLGQEGKKGFQPRSAVGMDTEDTFDNIMRESKLVDLANPKNAEVRNKLQGVFSKASLAVNRSALAALGWDPRQIVMDVATGKANIGGEYDPKSDVILSLGRPSNLVHESTHRGGR